MLQLVRHLLGSTGGRGKGPLCLLGNSDGVKAGGKDVDPLQFGAQGYSGPFEDRN